MSTDNDDAVPLALFLAAGVAAAVIAGVIAVAVFAKPGSAVAPEPPTAAMVELTPTPTAALLAAPAPAPTPAPTPKMAMNSAENLYFAVGSADLPSDAIEKLARVADAARSTVGASVLISGYHDATGGAAKNAELAKQRALAVRHALEANGVSPERLMMSKPVETTGGVDPKEARRVELRLQ